MRGNALKILAVCAKSPALRRDNLPAESHCFRQLITLNQWAV
jgi:hypothetical protein